MADDGLDVRGGAGSLVVEAELVRARAAALGRVATGVLSLAPGAAALGTDPAVRLAAVLDPVGAALLHARVLKAVAGPDGLLPVAGQLGQVVVALRVAAQAYEVADMTARDVLNWVWGHSAATALTYAGRAVAAGLGSGAAVPVTVGGVAVLGTAAAAWVGYRTWPVALDAAGDVAEDAARGDLDRRSLEARVRAAAEDVGTALLADAGAVGTATAEWAARHPWLTEQLLTTPVDVMAMSSVAGRAGWDLTTPLTGLPPAPEDLSDVGRWLLVGATASGLAREGSVRVRPVTTPVEVAGATGSAGLFARLAPATFPHAGHPVSGAGAGPFTPSRIRLERTAPTSGGPAAWTVFVPPTQTWSIDGGSNPFDGTSNLVGFSGARADAGDAVLEVLRCAGVPPDEPLLLVGYSQGGITAAQLAADEAVRRRYDVHAVMTVGSPVALVDMPDDVQVLSIQHSQDLVTVLDGEQNPSGPGWTTVTRDLLDEDTGDPEVAERLSRDPWVPHHYRPYAETTQMVDAADDESLRAWRQAVAPFLAADGTTTTATEWQATREGP